MTDTATETLPNRWDLNASFWVRIMREQRDRYRNELTDPAMLHAIGQPDGLAALDAGCGEGYFSRILARNGATVVGIDSSAKLIKAARAQSLADELPVSFDVGSVDELPYADGAFDLVVCNHLLNDLYDPSKAISEFARVLCRSGRLVILMLHPCFYNKHAERDQATNGLIAASYFETRSIEQTFEVGGLTSPVANTAWFRPLEFYTQELRKSGFLITSLTEPHPSPEQVRADNWWRKGFTRPLFMLLVAQKLPGDDG
jgi:2-polyprenyl-3-methyl-5-hydroxy-6-metoxy-1,4-benzoquinol methylase